MGSKMQKTNLEQLTVGTSELFSNLKSLQTLMAPFEISKML